MHSLLTNKPRLYWLDIPSQETNRVHMHKLLARSPVRHIAVQAHDAHLEFGGNTHRANTLSHVRALRQINKDIKTGQIAYVAENTLSYDYVPFWTTTLERIIANAPEDWGIIQLSYYCGPLSYQLAVHANRKNVDKLHDTYLTENHIIESVHAPFVPWDDHYAEGTTFYIVHPRGYTDVLKHVKRYKYDALYTKHSIPRFDPNVIASHLFALTKTYTFHLPMFTYRPHTKQLRDYTKTKNNLDRLVHIWYHKYIKWKEHYEKSIQQNHFIMYSI